MRQRATRPAKLSCTYTSTHTCTHLARNLCIHLLHPPLPLHLHLHSKFADNPNDLSAYCHLLLVATAVAIDSCIHQKSHPPTATTINTFQPDTMEPVGRLTMSGKLYEGN
jgi:hypothetical protein